MAEGSDGDLTTCDTTSPTGPGGQPKDLPESVLPQSLDCKVRFELCGYWLQCSGVHSKAYEAFDVAHL